jgi:hypothetical protein
VFGSVCLLYVLTYSDILTTEYTITYKYKIEHGYTFSQVCNFSHKLLFSILYLYAYEPSYTLQDTAIGRRNVNEILGSS